MRVAISTVRPFHVSMMANLLRARADRVDVYSSAPRKFFSRLDAAVQTHLVPSPVEVLNKFVSLPREASLHGIGVWDRAVAMLLPRADLVIGLATQALATARTARRRGMRFALDRACPHVDFQQQLVMEESERVGARFEPEPAWFRERQLAEYEAADLILTPSRYTAQSFAPELQSKIVIAPLLGRATAKGEIRLKRNTPFTVGVLGGNPLRKGYLYLLEAWKRLALPDARLRIRSGGDFSQYPRLAELLRELPSVEIVEYIPDIAEFYQGCDLFVLPSVDDGFGMALFEALANGVPSIATTQCGASELLTDGVDGLIIEPRNVDQLAEAILRVYRDEDLRQSLAHAGQQTVERVSAEGIYGRALAGVLRPSAEQAAPVLQHT
jgi:glycosyltransferase involved in cell wall biosynthesis